MRTADIFIAKQELELKMGQCLSDNFANVSKVDRSPTLVKCLCRTFNRSVLPLWSDTNVQYRSGLVGHESLSNKEINFLILSSKNVF